MKFVVIFGPPASGKMTVGCELAKLTGLKLFHNHMTLDLVLNFFDFGQPPFERLVGEFRRRIFEEVAASRLPGLIFTYVWALDDVRDKQFIDGASDLFRRHGGTTYFVELECDLAQRLARNETAFRLTQKPSKRDLAKSRERLLLGETAYKMNSREDFFYRENYLKICNTDLSAADAAQKIVRQFDLPVIA